ncbi:MAG: phosphodiester glycosidase family protein [Clostridia bacterium]|nr:phosphodiester glycosidase family protein [Clostridia bacterium]
MKKLICFILTFLIVQNAAAALWEKTSESAVIRGVTHKSIKRLTENGWQKLNVIYADMSDDNVALRVLTSSNGGGTRETTKKMAQQSNAAAAINADYFNTLINPTYPLGMVFQDGEFKSTPTDINLGAFAVTETGGVIMDYFSFSATATSPQGYICQIDALNKVPVETGGVTALTDWWGMSYGSHGNMAEMLITDGKVAGIYTEQAAFEIPAGSMVLVTNRAINGFLTDNFAVGDEVEIDIRIAPDTDAIQEATGGGSVIVENGAVAPFTNEVKGTSQRTAIGVDESGETVIMLTVDGRQSTTPGMTQTELAETMIELGAYRALNLDGGGSTTMVTRNRVTGEHEVRNYMPTLRAVSTSIGVFGTHAAAAPVGLEISLSQETVVFGSSAQVFAALFDEYGNTIETPAEALTISCSDPYAVITGNEIIPASGGTHTVTVSASGLEARVQLEVITDITEIHIYPDALTLGEDETHSLALTAVDAFGNKAQLPADFADWSVEKGGALVSPGLVTGGTGGVISASYNSLKAYAAVNTAESSYSRMTDVRAADDMHFWQAGAKTINIIGDMDAPKTFLNMCLEAMRVKKLQNGALTIATKTLPSAFSGESRTCEEFSVFDESFVRFVIMGQKPDWAAFINAINTSQGDMVVVMPESVYSFSEDERELFGDILSGVTGRGNLAIVISAGDTSECRADSGVRYITLGPMDGTSIAQLAEYRERSKYVAIHIGESLSYTFEKM